MDITEGAKSEFQRNDPVPFFRFAKGWGTLRGLWVVLLGPDGAGKSAVIGGIATVQPAGFTGCATYHLRPTLLRRRSNTNCDPHGQSARGALISAVKLIYLLVANWLGYLLVVRPRRSQGNLILFDRYFPDCVVDPKRYRLPTSCQRMTELVARLMPKPDLYVVLEAPASVLRERKREVTEEESERQRRDYSLSMARLPNVAAVDAARPLTEVVEDVIELVSEFRQAKCSSQYEVG